MSGKGEECFRPLFTYHGFRYAEITVSGVAEIIDITAEAMYTDLTSAGDFSCSDEIVTKIYQNALWGQRDNFLNVPTDCPQRDERLGWTGDAQIFCQSAMYNMDCRKFYEKFLADIRDAQLGNGVIPAVAPLPPMWDIMIIQAVRLLPVGVRRLPKSHTVITKCTLTKRL